MSWKKNLDSSWNFLLHISQCLLNTKVYLHLPVGDDPQPMMSGMISLYYVFFLKTYSLFSGDRILEKKYNFRPTRKEILRLIINVRSNFKLCVKGN